MIQVSLHILHDSSEGALETLDWTCLGKAHGSGLNGCKECENVKIHWNPIQLGSS